MLYDTLQVQHFPRCPNACTVSKNELRTETYKPLFGDEEVENYMQMNGVCGSHRTLNIRYAVI